MNGCPPVVCPCCVIRFRVFFSLSSPKKKYSFVQYFYFLLQSKRKAKTVILKQNNLFKLLSQLLSVHRFVCVSIKSCLAYVDKERYEGCSIQFVRCSKTFKSEIKLILLEIHVYRLGHDFV